MRSVTIMIMRDSLGPAYLRIRDVECHELLGQLALVHELCPVISSCRSDGLIRSTSRLKARLATHSFGLRGQLLSPARIITLRALASLRKQRSSASHVFFNIARQRGPLGPEKAIGACPTASNHEIHKNPSCDKFCSPVDLCTRDNNKHAVHTRSFLDT